MRSFPNRVPIKGRVRECLNLIKKQKLAGKVIVDVGSSFGWLEKELILSKAKLTGIEPDTGKVNFAQRQLGKRVKFIVGSTTKIPLEDKTADIVIFFDVIEHLPKGTELMALKEISRVLNKNGILFLTTPNSSFLANLLDPAWYIGHRHYDKSSLHKLLTKANFQILSHEVKGGLVSLIYMLWFYFVKWVFRQKQPRSEFLEELDDKSYNSPGYVTNFVIARK